MAKVDVLGMAVPPFAILSNGTKQGRHFHLPPNLNQVKSMTHWSSSCRHLLLHMFFALGHRAVGFMWLMSDHLEGNFSFSPLPLHFSIISL